MAERLIHIRFWFLVPEYQLATLPGAKPEVTGFVNPPAKGAT
jgi:hypothetical protein